MARIDGELKSAQPEILSSLPSGPQPLNRLVQSFGDIYTWNGTMWVKILSTSNVGTLFSNLTPSVIQYLSGSGTHRASYWFNVLSATAVVGATYTNNGVTFQVQRTITGGGQLLLRATTAGTPQSAGTLTKASGTGDATISFASVRAPLYSIVEMVGGGGAGGSGNTGTFAGSGGNTTFGTATANGGTGGSGAGSATAGTGGVFNAGTFDRIFACNGSRGSAPGASGGTYNLGGVGGGTPLGPGGSVTGNAVGVAPSAANTGVGGAGGSINATAGLVAGAGGGSGAYGKLLNVNPLTPQSYSIGAAGTFVAGGVNGFQGGNGSDGIVVVTDYFQ